MRAARARRRSAEYSFRTRWVLDAAPARCWGELERSITGASPPWWPGMTIVTPAVRLAPGERVRIEVRAPLGYTLRCDLRLTQVGAARTLAARSEGDLAGDGGVDIRSCDRGTEIRFRWDVAVRKRWMRVLSPVLRPVFALAHGRVMRAGERGLRRALGSGVRKPVNPAPRAGSGAPAR